MPPPRILVLLAVSYVLSFGSGGIQLPLTSTAMAHVGLSMSAIGVMWAARSVLGIFGPALWGVLADRRGDTRPFAVASLLIGAGLLLMLAATTSAPPAIVIFGLYGLFAGSSGSLLDGMVIGALGDEKQRFGRWRAWGTIGFGVSACGSAFLIDRELIHASPSTLFPVCALLTGSGGLVLLLLPRMPRPPLGRILDVLPVLRRPDLLALFATSTLLWCSHVGYSSFVTTLAVARGLPEWSVGVSLFAAIVVEAVMLRESPWFLTRFGARGIMLGVCALAVVRWTLTAFAASPAPFIALNALHGVTFGLFFATLVTLVAQRVPPEMRQAAQGVVGSSSFGLGGGLGSLIVGFVLERTDAQITWLVLAAVALASLVVAWRWVKE
jgi:PPP family 3-phenylpropionic acid transporter